MSTRVDSPLLGRMDILRGIRQSSGVRRSLFGPVDHEQVKSDLQKLKDEQAKVDQEKWNFDFKEEKPLPGSYKWVPIDHQDSSDDEDNVVITTHVRLQHSPVSESREDDQEHYNRVEDGVPENGQETPSSSCRKNNIVPTSINITAKSSQPKINEIFRSKKRKCDEITASSSPKQQKLSHNTTTSQTESGSSDSTAV